MTPEPDWLCEACSRGKHLHDRLIPNGEDGGCSYALWENHTMLAVCGCTVRLPPEPIARIHKCPTCRCGARS